MLKLSKKDIARFWTKVDKSGGEDACWPWLASQDGRGYGQFTVKQLGLWKPIKAHRISCFLKYKVLSSCTCHHCDNPICCNPSHLYNGSRKTNRWDAVKRHRSNNPKGEQNSRSKFTDKDIKLILSFRKHGKTYQEIANHFHCGYTIIQYIINGRRWNHITGIKKS